MKYLLICTWVASIVYVMRRLQESRRREFRGMVPRARREQKRGDRAWQGYPDAEMIETYGNGR
jgi:hypothetical protein